MWNTSWCCIAIRSVKWSACKYQVIIDQQVIFISLTSIESSSNKVDTVERSASVSHDENYKREKRLVRTRSFVSFPFFRSTRVRFAVFVRWNGVSRQFRHRQFRSIVGSSRLRDVDTRDELLERMMSEGLKSGRTLSRGDNLDRTRAMPWELLEPWKSNRVARNPFLFRADTLDVAGRYK